MSIFDIIVLVVAIFALVRGAITGLMRQLGVLLGVIVAFLFTKLLSPYVAQLVLWMTSGEVQLNGTLLYAIVFVTLVLLTYVFAVLIHKTTKALKIAWIDRLAGAIFSLAKYMIIASILLNLYVTGYKYIYNTEPKVESVSYTPLLNFSTKILDFAGHFGLSFDTQS